MGVKRRQSSMARRHRSGDEKRDDEYQHMMFREWKVKTGRKNLSIRNGGIYVLEPERVVGT